jgi:phospholipid/cholesterol/gamma-HCH transport system substrate-binding protein
MSAVNTASEILMEVQEGDGFLHSLIYDRFEGFQVEGIERSLASLEKILSEIAHGEGPLHRLIYGSEDEEDLLVQSAHVVDNLNRILEKIESGDGTLGLLVNDPSLYHDLQVLLGGAQRSLVVRALLRLSMGNAP